MSARSHCALCGVDCHDCEHALTAAEQGALGIDAETAIVCLDCTLGAEIEVTALALDAIDLPLTARWLRGVTGPRRAHALRAARETLDAFASGFASARGQLVPTPAERADRAEARPRRPTPVLPCRCDDDAARECSGGGLPRGARGLCSCRCHGAETAPPAGEATD